MSFYRTVLTAVAAVVIASPVFADDTAAPAKSDAAATPVVASADNNMQSDVSTEQKSSANEAASTGEAQVVININKATVKQLEKVKGINAAKAKAIVKYRKKHGNFKSLDELSKVKGFSKLKADDLQMIKDQLKAN